LLFRLRIKRSRRSLERPAASSISADAARLTDALKWLLGTLRRELVTTDRLVVRAQPTTHDGVAAHELQFGDEETLAALEAEAADGQVLFDE
jgi:hypothetical protein